MSADGYSLGTDHWGEWFKRMNEKEDRDDYMYRIHCLTSASSGFGISASSLEDLRVMVERYDLPVIISHAPHVTILVMPKDPNAWGY